MLVRSLQVGNVLNVESTELPQVFHSEFSETGVRIATVVLSQTAEKSLFLKMSHSTLHPIWEAGGVPWKGWGLSTSIQVQMGTRTQSADTAGRKTQASQCCDSTWARHCFKVLPLLQQCHDS